MIAAAHEQPLDGSPEEDLFVLDELFDELVAQAQAQPDDDTVFDSLRDILAAKQEQGDIGFVMARAMELAAMACTDPHFEDIADEAGSIFTKMGGHGADDGHGHGNGSSAGRGHHESETKTTKSKKKKAGQSLWQLIFSYGQK